MSELLLWYNLVWYHNILFTTVFEKVLVNTVLTLHEGPY